MFLLRLVVFLILVSLVVILAYPLLIIFDLANGGDGFGLCNDLVNCEIPFLEGPRILIILIITFFFLVAVLRVIMKYLNNINKEQTIL
tara:strand:+ start:279 stop:542 length:264 start_codon:yes stop_codon:yes gene_type:complete